MQLRTVGVLIAGYASLTMTILLLGLMTVSHAEHSDRTEALRAEKTHNVARMAAIDQEAGPTATELQQVLAAIDEHNSHKPDPTNPAAVATFNREADRLNQNKSEIAAKLQALQDEQDRLIARNLTIDAALNEPKTNPLVAREQDEFDQMNAAWMRAQERLIRDAVAYGSQWRNAVLASLQTGVPPEQMARPKTMADVLPGDILLFEPEGWSVAIPPLDHFYRSAEEFARGQVFAAIAQQKEPASHAITVVKRVNGVTLFLDHTHVGSRILDQKELDRLYANRRIYVARPQTVIDGRQLWETARAAALRRTSDFGVTPGKLVCSERAGIAVAKATGLDMHTKRLGPIDVTPGDFFDSQSVGKYFVISPLEPGP
ncbi:MAG: hypothetical protein NTX84_08540 [Nitrospirae bacterium]|nr:hypothetical protein [Nitrospirota bacterium]